MRPVAGDSGAEIAALVHRLEVHQAELELQNHELRLTNEELRLSNLALEAARDRYRALHELAPVPLVTLDCSGTILAANHAAELVFRAPQAELIDRRLRLFAEEASRCAIAELLTELFRDGGVRGVDAVFEVAGAEPVELMLDGVLLTGEVPPRAVVACVDVTARRRIEQARRAVERRAEQDQRLQALGVLAGGIAHDFNNLMAVVLGSTELALDHVGGGSELAQSLGEARQAARQAGALAQQMLAFSGKASAPEKPLDLRALLRELEPLARSSAKLIPLSFAFPDHLAPIIGDETQLRQIVLNLVINAAEAMVGRAGAISIGANDVVLTASDVARLRGAGTLVPGPYVVLEVRDQGIGMDEVTRMRILEPYFSTKLAGRGLGLAVVHGIVRGHGGALQIESEPGRGTMFSVYLPATSQQPTRARTPSQADRAWRGRGTVLLVDDEPEVRRTTERLLKRLGFDVVCAASGEEAVELVRASPARFAMVVTDQTMPGMDGIAAGRAIRALSASLPMVLISGYGEIRDAGELFGGVLGKPFGVDALAEMLHSLLTS